MKTWAKNVAFVGVGMALALGGVFAAVKIRARSQPPLPYRLRDDILIRGNSDLREVALTFDDGPKPEIARELLNILGKEQVRATFFVVGKQVNQNPGLVRRMMNEGHEVGNHTFDHERLDSMTPEKIKAEIVSCDKAILKATGARSNLFRPPGMRYDDTVINTAQDLGYVTIHWNVAAKDFDGGDPFDIAKRVIDKSKQGSVILLHGHPDTLRALPEIVRTLREKGYRFVTVSQMLSRLPRPVIVKSNAYAARDPEPVVQKVAPQKVATTSPTRRSKRSFKATPKPALVPTKASPPRIVDTPAWN